MSKLLAVFGATGQQGGSVINYVLNDTELSKQYRLRAVTRNVNSNKAKQLAKEIEVVRGDSTDIASLKTALAGVHTVFIMTVPSFASDSFETELNEGKNIADIAVEQGVKYIIFSTLPNVKSIFSGKYTKVAHFDAKAAIETYIQDLPIKSAFYCPGIFLQNFHSIPLFSPQKISDDTWALARFNSPKALFPMVDAVGDTGKFVGAILAEPDKYEGKTFHAATALYSSEEMASIISKPTGKTVVYKQTSLDDFKQKLPLPIQDLFAETFSYPEEFGYYGPNSEELVSWAVENARGKLTTPEQYFEANPLQLAWL